MLMIETVKQIGVRLYAEQLAWVEAESERRGLTLADVVRECITKQAQLQARKRARQHLQRMRRRSTRKGERT